MNNITSELRQEANEWRFRLEDGLTEAELADFDRWLAGSRIHVEALAEAETFWSATGRSDYLAQLAPMVEQRLQKASAAEARDPEHEFNLFPMSEPSSVFALYSNKLVGASLALAASVAVFIAIGGPQFLGTRSQSQVQSFVTLEGNTQLIRLADETRVTLGSDSRLEVEFTQNARNVRLGQGDASFDVTSNRARPFTVATEIGEVLVTGTRFNMRLGEEDLTIAVAEGSVRVSKVQADETKVNSPTVTLVAYQAIDLNARAGFGEIYEAFPRSEAGKAVRTVETVPVTRQLVYVREPLQTIAEDLNRYTDRPIRVSDDVAMLELSGTYDAQDLDAVLRSVEEALPVRVVTMDQETLIVPREPPRDDLIAP